MQCQLAFLVISERCEYHDCCLIVNAQWYFKGISQPYFKEIHDTVYIFVIKKMWLLFLKQKTIYIFIPFLVLVNYFILVLLICKARNPISFNFSVVFA